MAVEHKFKVGDVVAFTNNGIVFNLLHNEQPYIITELHTEYPWFRYKGQKYDDWEHERDFRYFDECLPVLEEHIEECKTKLKELRHIQMNLNKKQRSTK